MAHTVLLVFARTDVSPSEVIATPLVEALETDIQPLGHFRHLYVPLRLAFHPAWQGWHERPSRVEVPGGHKRHVPLLLKISEDCISHPGLQLSLNPLRARAQDVEQPQKDIAASPLGLLYIASSFISCPSASVAKSSRRRETRWKKALLILSILHSSFPVS